MSFRGSRTRPTTLRTRENFEIQFSIDPGVAPRVSAQPAGTSSPLDTEHVDPPILVGVSLAMCGLATSARLKFALVRSATWALCFSVAEAAGVSPGRLTSPLSGHAEAYAVQSSTILPQSPRRMVSKALSHEPELATRSPEVPAGLMLLSQLAKSETPRRGRCRGCGGR